MQTDQLTQLLRGLGDDQERNYYLLMAESQRLGLDGISSLRQYLINQIDTVLDMATGEWLEDDVAKAVELMETTLDELEGVLYFED